MKKGVYGAVLLAAALVPLATSHAEEPVATMEEVVVTATRQKEKIASVPADVSVITEKEIEQSGAQNIPDLLRTEAGIQVIDVTGNKRSFRVDLRGFGETAQSNTLVLVDGRRINEPDLSGTDWNLIDLGRVKRIEVIRGGRGSVLYGDNASGGVVNIITKEGEEGFGAGATVSGGSYDTFKSSAYASGTKDNLSYDLSGSYYNTNGYRLNSDSEAKDAGLNVGYFLGESVKLNFSTDYHKDSTGLPGAIKESEFAAGVSRKDTLFPSNFADTEDYYFKGGPEIYFWNNSLVKADVSYRNRKAFSYVHFDFVGGSGDFQGDTEIETVAFSPQVIIREKIFGHQNNLTGGYDYSDAEEDIANTSTITLTLLAITSSTTKNYVLEKKNSSYYIQDELYLLDKLAISGGFRHDRVKYLFTPSTRGAAIMDEDVFNVGINYNYADKSNAYFSFARSFRDPVLDELFNFSSNTINTGLTPQTSDDYEIGVRHYFAKSLYVNLNLFRINTRDEIFFRPPNLDVLFDYGANENLDGKTRRDGVEISFKQSLERLNLYGSYTYTDAKIRGGQFANNNIPSVPKHKWTLGSEYLFDRGFSIALTGYYIGERPFESDYAGQFDKQEDYFILNSELAYKRGHLKAFVDINNITNEKYSEFGVIGVTTPDAGPPFKEKGFYPSPEINVLAGVSFSY